MSLELGLAIASIFAFWMQGNDDWRGGCGRRQLWLARLLPPHRRVAAGGVERVHLLCAHSERMEVMAAGEVH
jgi:hypothetical protein